MTTIQQYLDRLNSLSDYYLFSATPGRKYTKIIQTSDKGRGQRSVHAFVDADGNVYKPASWAQPAKGIRYNLRDVETMVMDPYGGYLYQR